MRNPSRIQGQKDSGSAAKNLRFFNPKLFPSSHKNDLGSSSRIRIFKHRILDTDPQHFVLETHVRGRPRSSVADGGSGAFLNPESGFEISFLQKKSGLEKNRDKPVLQIWDPVPFGPWIWDPE
jgi:hypothetical protein